jgi:hypothetical protein
MRFGKSQLTSSAAGSVKDGLLAVQPETSNPTSTVLSNFIFYHLLSANKESKLYKKNTVYQRILASKT